MLAATNVRPSYRLIEPGTVLVVKSNVGMWRPDRLLPRASTGIACRAGRELHARAHPCLGRSPARVATRGCAPARARHAVLAVAPGARLPAMKGCRLSAE